MGWYTKLLISQVIDEIPTHHLLEKGLKRLKPTIFLKSVPPGYKIRKDKDKGWSVINPNGSILVYNEPNIRQAIRSAIWRINQLVS